MEQHHHHQDTPTNPEIIQSMLQACSTGDQSTAFQIVSQHGLVYGCYQDPTTGQSPLMVAAQHGHLNLVNFLLQDCKAPWNAVDRNGNCAGNYATNQQHWEIVDRLVDWGTCAELILGRIERQCHQNHHPIDGPVVEHESSTKPEYLRHPLQYQKEVLLDRDQDAVMMEWERPLMKAHAQILMQGETQKRVLNVGFGMGIIDGILQNEHSPAHHTIIEAHPDVYQRMKETGWLDKPNVRVCFGKWQDVIPQLIREGTTVDAIFFDTYGEHYLDMEDFHVLMAQILAKPHGVYSFFNGLAPDNIFFHGVACQCVKLQLSSLGLDSEFATCEIHVDNNVWENVRRKYWHGRTTYYLPIVKWNPQFLSTGQVPEESPLLKRKGDETMDTDDEANKKRPAC